MITSLLLALALSAAQRQPIAAQAVETQNLLEVSGPTHFADGEIRGATVGRVLKLNQPLELYQVSGRTLCQSASATATMPPDAGSGWRLVIVPLKLGRELVLRVSWQRLWERGEALTNGPKGSAVVTLQPGKRVLLDYIIAGPNQGVAGTATQRLAAARTELATYQRRGFKPGHPMVDNLERVILKLTKDAETEALQTPVGAVVRNSPECGAIGMGLQIGLSPVESQNLVETNLWLVRTLADGTERSVRQTVRARVGSTIEFFFDDEKIVLSTPGAPPIERAVRTFGSVKPLDIVSGQVRAELLIAQYLVAGPGSSDPMPGGSATYELTARPDEVVAFRVPRGTDDTGRIGERMSLRIQMKALNR